jgi:hypothetical protein
MCSLLYYSCSSLYIIAAQLAPKIVATIYTHKQWVFPDTIAGPMDLAGFIEAPQIGPANMASNPTVAPMAIPAKPFTAFP